MSPGYEICRCDYNPDGRPPGSGCVMLSTMTKHLSRFVLLVVAFLTLAGTGWAQTPEAVVEKYLAALGGRDALGKLTSRKSAGTVVVTTQGTDLAGTIELFLKSPNKTRALITLDLSAVGGGGSLTIDQRFDGTAGWALNSMQGDMEITGNQLDNMRNNAFPTPLLNYKTSGVKLELLPNEKVNGKDASVVLATPKAGSAVKMYFDADTSLLLRTVSKISAPQVGEVEQTSDFSDYRAVDTVKLPFHVVNANPLQTVSTTFNKVEQNVAIDDAMFVKK